MNRFYFPLFAAIFLLFPGLLTAQDTIQLNGVIYDAVTKKPVPYANVGIFEHGIGTVSNDSGQFFIQIPNVKQYDSLTFSRIGYHAQKRSLAVLLKEKKNEVWLSPKTFRLKEVKIASKKLNARIKGNKTKARSIMLGLNSRNLGHEIGTLIRLPDKPVYIEDFNFHIISNRPDSVKFRLNIYHYDKEIGKNLLKKNIYFTVPGKVLGDYQVDLRKYNIEVQGNIFVSVEVLVNYISQGPDPSKKFDQYHYDRLDISGTLTGSKSFNRKISLGKWEKTPYHFSPGFWMTVAY